MSPTVTTLPETPRYTTSEIVLHWTIAGLVLYQWLMGQGMADIFYAIRDGADRDGYGPAFVHVGLGLTILVLVVVRLGMRLRRPGAPLPESRDPRLDRAARLLHLSFYALLIAMPVLGAVAWWGESGAFGVLHSVLAWALALVVVAYAGLALYQRFALGEDVLRRLVRPT